MPRARKAGVKKRTYVKRNQASSMYKAQAVRGRGKYTRGTKKQTHMFVPKNSGVHFDTSYGSRLGSVIGEGVQSLASVFGLGDYHIKQNSLMSDIDMGTSPPMVRNTSRGEATIIHHREYLGELISGTGSPSAFTIQAYDINPGNSAMFPWLSPIASMFQEWEARGIIVELKTETSDVVATGGFLGSMFACVDYDVLSAAPTTKIQLENYEYASSCKPSCSLIMPVECKPRNDVMTHLYTVIDSNYPGGSDARLYDLGQLFIGTEGLPAQSTPVAEIWVSYEIAFYKPKVPLSGELPLIQSAFYQTGITQSTPLGTISVPFQGNPGNVYVASTGNGIQLPALPGTTWLIMLQYGADVLKANAGYSMITEANITFARCALSSQKLFAYGESSPLQSYVSDSVVALTGTTPVAQMFNSSTFFILVDILSTASNVLTPQVQFGSTVLSPPSTFTNPNLVITVQQWGLTYAP